MMHTGKEDFPSCQDHANLIQSTFWLLKCQLLSTRHTPWVLDNSYFP